MQTQLLVPSRRVFLGAFGAALFTTRGLFADQLARTPFREEGPFYPDKLPLDTDNDLIIINDSLTPAVGEITHLTGNVLDTSGSPIRNATDRDLAVRRQGGLPPHRRQRRSDQRTRTSRDSAGSPRARPASIASARSSPSPTRAGPLPTSTSRSRKAIASC